MLPTPSSIKTRDRSRRMPTSSISNGSKRIIKRLCGLQLQLVMEEQVACRAIRARQEAAVPRPRVVHLKLNLRLRGRADARINIRIVSALVTPGSNGTRRRSPLRMPMILNMQKKIETMRRTTLLASSPKALFEAQDLPREARWRRTCMDLTRGRTGSRNAKTRMTGRHETNTCNRKASEEAEEARQAAEVEVAEAAVEAKEIVIVTIKALRAEEMIDHVQLHQPTEAATKAEVARAADVVAAVTPVGWIKMAANKSELENKTRMMPSSGGETRRWRSLTHREPARRVTLTVICDWQHKSPVSRIVIVDRCKREQGEPPRLRQVEASITVESTGLWAQQLESSTTEYSPRGRPQRSSRYCGVNSQRSRKTKQACATTTSTS